MTTEFFDPDDDEDELMPQLTPEPADIETDDDELEATLDPMTDEPVLEHRAEHLVPTDILLTDVDGEKENGIQAGNAALEAIGKQAQPQTASLLPIPPQTTDEARNLLLPVGRVGEGGAQKLPGSLEPDGASVELYSTERVASPQQPTETPPVVVRHLPPLIDGTGKGVAKEGRERLRIEIEITLANAERISRIAVEEAKAEFKKLASQATQRLDEKFYEYRANQRLLRRG